MKMLKALPVILLVLGTSAAFADDQQLTNRLAVARTQQNSAEQSTTVAAYAGQRGVGESAAPSQSADPRLELRDNGHGALRTQYTQQ